MRNRIAQLDVDDDAQLLVELPHQRRLGGLAIANVATKQVPHIRIPPTVRGAVTKQRPSVADKQSGDDGVHKGSEPAGGLPAERPGMIAVAPGDCRQILRAVP